MPARARLEANLKVPVPAHGANSRPVGRGQAFFGGMVAIAERRSLSDFRQNSSTVTMNSARDQVSGDCPRELPTGAGSRTF